MPKSKVIQKWRCRHCGATYESPIHVIEITCPNTHQVGKTRGRFFMELVEGDPYVPPSTTRKQ